MWRRKNERLSDNCILEADRYGGTNIMVWGAISYDYKSQLHFCEESVTGQYYTDNILSTIVVPMLQNNTRISIFQQDNARAHTSGLANTFLQRNNIPCLPWPAVSADLAPIEHVWDILGRKVLNRVDIDTNQSTLKQILQEEWDNITQNEIIGIIKSMRRRCVV